jgi:hypothetical protein
MFISKKRLKRIEERLEELEQALQPEKPEAIRRPAKKDSPKILRAKGKKGPSNDYFDGVKLD